MTDYVPIDCGLHSEYELAIMQRDPVRLSWQDNDGNLHVERVQLADLLTRDGEEFMVVSCANGEHHDIRLDRIMRLEPVHS